MSEGPIGRGESSRPDAAAQRAALRAFLRACPKLFVLTGAGVSTDSGIPDYRDLEGKWKRPPPMNYDLFMREPDARARYWARSMVGWRTFGRARPNAAHDALARLEQTGRISLLVTQNVDRLHQAAGSCNVVDLHGRLDQVRCMSCEARLPRAEWQVLLEAANPQWLAREASVAPDGDADLDETDFTDFRVPDCPVCGGIVKPDVVFFGESVPRDRVDQAMAALAASNGMLVVGSSLMVYSGYRFATAAALAGTPIAAVNLGQTRADALLTLKIDLPIAHALTSLTEG